MPIKLGLSTNEEWLIPPFLVKNVIDPTQPKPSHCTVGDLNKFFRYKEDICWYEIDPIQHFLNCQLNVWNMKEVKFSNDFLAHYRHYFR